MEQATTTSFFMSREDEDAHKIIQALREDPKVVVKMRCFSEDEANILRAKLSPEDQRRVMFTWLVFK